MRLDIRFVSPLLSPLSSCSKSCHTVNTSITRIDELREDMEMKHSRLLCELQESREQLLELSIGDVGKEDGKETRRISNLKEGSVVKVTDDEGKSNRRKEWERTKSRLGSLVRRH
mgnify:CR=1 FL=1